ncbi:MAG: hypothetical protein ACXVQ3_01545 [Gaiellaceae bacterium]
MDHAGFKADELDQLRRWGTGLQNDIREEVSAAGRAIVLLIEEIERLHVLAWDHRLYPESAPGRPPELTASLRGRLRQRLGRDRPHLDPTDQEGFHS